MMAAIEAQLFTYLETKIDKATALEEARELAHGLEMSLAVVEAFINAKLLIEKPELDTIDVGDEDHMDIKRIPNPELLVREKNRNQNKIF